jgi:hypothetical protein
VEPGLVEEVAESVVSVIVEPVVVALEAGIDVDCAGLVGRASVVFSVSVVLEGLHADARDIDAMAAPAVNIPALLRTCRRVNLVTRNVFPCISLELFSVILNLPDMVR